MLSTRRPLIALDESVATTDQWSARRSASAADDARCHRLELRPAQRGRASFLFRHLAAFAGGFTLEAAEAVAAACGIASGEVFEAIAGLVDQSLLRRDEGPDGEPRYAMLETIRDYGLEQLEASGEAEDTRQRMAEWLLRLAERAFPELFGPAQRRWLDRLEAEIDNIRVVLGWAVDQGEAETAQRLAFATVRLVHERAFRRGPQLGRASARGRADL